jgi:hypothetical protein
MSVRNQVRYPAEDPCALGYRCRDRRSVGETSLMDPCMASRAVRVAKSGCPNRHVCDRCSGASPKESGHPTCPRYLYPRNTASGRSPASSVGNGVPGLVPGGNVCSLTTRRACLSLNARPQKHSEGVAHALAPPSSRTLPAFAFSPSRGGSQSSGYPPISRGDEHRIAHCRQGSTIPQNC